MKTQEISVTMSQDGTIKLPRSLVEKFKPGQVIRLVAITEDESEDQLWLRASAEHFFSDDDPADQLYADYARKVVK
jgi:hypothetical protein